MKDESGIEMIYDWPNNRRSKRSTGQVKGFTTILFSIHYSLFIINLILLKI